MRFRPPGADSRANPHFIALRPDLQTARLELMKKLSLLGLALSIAPVACTTAAGSEAASGGISETDPSTSTGDAGQSESSADDTDGPGTAAGSGGLPSGTGSPESTGSDATIGDDDTTTSGTSGDNDTSTSGASGDGGTTTTAETGEDGSSSSSSGEPVWDGPCPPYSGLANVGSTWDAVSTPAYEAANSLSYTWHREVTAVSMGDPTIVTVVLTQPMIVETGNYTTTLTYTYVCDENGAALQRLENEAIGTINGQPFETWNNTNYSPPWLAVPWDIEVGSQWVAASNLTTTSAQGTSTSSAGPWDIEVVAEDSETVLGLDYDCLRIEWDNGMGFDGWYCADAVVGSLATGFNADTLTAVNVVPW